MDNMKEKMKEAKTIYYHEDFRRFMRNLHGFTDADLDSMKSKLQEFVLNSPEKDPLKFFNEVMMYAKGLWQKPQFPFNADWHHYLVPGIIMAVLRNHGYEISGRDIEEAMSRGEKLPGGSCGFAGTCGGAYSAGIVISIINKTTPLHLSERSSAMEVVVKVLNEIARYPVRCCKRSSYIAMEKTIEHLRAMGFTKISCPEIKCVWSSMNGMCMRKQCPYFGDES